MDIQKLLIADASPELCAVLAKLLGEDFSLRICHNGRQAKELLNSFRPDILLIDLMLPALDGISVLKSLEDADFCPAVLATTGYTSPYIENALGALGVELLMLKPCDFQALADHIHHLSCKTEHPVLPLSGTPKTASEVLLSLGLMSKWRGFRYLKDAVVLYGKNPGQSVTKELYPAVAKLHDTNAQSVERAIRAAIHTAWDHADEKVWKQYLPSEPSGRLPRPTNTVFISALAKFLSKQEENDCLKQKCV